jgi:hypothetical protein
MRIKSVTSTATGSLSLPSKRIIVSGKSPNDIRAPREEYFVVKTTTIHIIKVMRAVCGE